MAYGGMETPPLLEDFFVKKISKLYAYDSLTLYIKLHWLTFENIQGSGGPIELSGDLFLTRSKRKLVFVFFRVYFREFSIFFHEIFIVARSYRVLAADIKSLLISALVSLETRLKVPILALFWRFFKLSVFT